MCHHRQQPCQQPGQAAGRDVHGRRKRPEVRDADAVHDDRARRRRHGRRGRAAEQVALNEISTGASNDLEVATGIAKDMLTVYGMDEKIGPLSIKVDDPYEIQIFGDNFVKNNKDKLFLIINNHYSELISTKKILKDDYLEVILVQKSDIKITNLSYMFQECIYLNNFEKFKFHDLIDFNDVEDISYMFNKCNVIKELNLNLFGSFKKVKSMEGTFSKCTLLKKINGMDKWK